MTDTDGRQRLIGIALVALSASMFGVVDGLTKLLVTQASPAQIVFARYGFALLLLLATRRPSTLPQLMRTARPGQQLARGLVPLIVSFGMVFAVTYLPLADATAILFVAPLLMVAFAGPLIGERAPRASWLAVGVGFVGVLVVARPGFSVLSQYAVFPLVAAVSYALYQLLTRRLSAAGEPPLTTLGWTLGIGTLVVAPIAPFFWQPLDAMGWVLMVLLGAAFALAQITLIAGLVRTPLPVAASLNYVQIIAAVAFGAAVFGELPDLMSWAGIVLIVGAGLYMIRHRTKG